MSFVIIRYFKISNKTVLLNVKCYKLQAEIGISDRQDILVQLIKNHFSAFSPGNASYLIGSTVKLGFDDL
jgi:hypothetical protein